jgi:hypothetical protein
MNLHIPEYDARAGFSDIIHRISIVVKGDAFKTLSVVQLSNLDLLLRIAYADLHAAHKLRLVQRLARFGHCLL